MKKSASNIRRLKSEETLALQLPMVRFTKSVTGVGSAAINPSIESTILSPAMTPAKSPISRGKVKEEEDAIIEHRRAPIKYHL